NNSTISYESSEISIEDQKEILRIKYEKLSIQREKNNESESKVIL
ncbi:15646_t:CDS:1, partial [Gigaspora margarita]